MMKVNKGQKDKGIGEKKKKRNKGQHVDIETCNALFLFKR